MMFPFKKNFSLLPVGISLTAFAVLSGCGGGGSGNGGGNNATPTPTLAPGVTPTPPPPSLNATYNATFVPTDAVTGDGKAPTGTLTLAGTKVSSQTTFYLQPSVVKAVQAAIDQGLRDNNVGYAIGDNQAPASIAFTPSGTLDGNGKVVLTSKKSVSICGTATLTLDPTFTLDGTTATATGTGTYQIAFPNELTVVVRGTVVHPKPKTGGVVFTCNNLPLRTGTVTFAKQ